MTQTLHKYTFLMWPERNEDGQLISPEFSFSQKFPIIRGDRVHRDEFVSRGLLHLNRQFAYCHRHLVKRMMRQAEYQVEYRAPHLSSYRSGGLASVLLILSYGLQIEATLSRDEDVDDWRDQIWNVNQVDDVKQFEISKIREIDIISSCLGGEHYSKLNELLDYKARLLRYDEHPPEIYYGWSRFRELVEGHDRTYGYNERFSLETWRNIFDLNVR